MTHKLFIDADTALEFSSRAKAFIYTETKGSTAYCLLTTGYTKGRASVFNNLIIQNNEQGGVEYFGTEQDAMKYIGSFL